MSLIHKKYPTHYEYQGTVYESLDELRRKEKEKIDTQLSQYVNAKWSERYNEERYGHMLNDRGYSELHFKTNLLDKYDDIRHIFFKIEQDREALDNALRLFAWEESCRN